MPATKKADAAPAWNVERRALFLDALSLNPNVSLAERKADMPAGSAYKERRKTPGFADAWADALADGYTRLEMELLQRALKGESKRTTKRGEATIVEDYSNRLGMALLAAHRAVVEQRRSRAAPVDAESAKQRLARKIEDMRRRLADA